MHNFHFGSNVAFELDGNSDPPHYYYYYYFGSLPFVFTPLGTTTTSAICEIENIIGGAFVEIGSTY